MFSLIATQMNDARTNSAAQPAVALPAWGDDASDRLGYDGAGRMITKRYLTGGIDGSGYGYVDTTALVGFTTSFDRASNKLYERHLHAEERSHLYQPFNADGSFAVGYDSANRLRQYQRGVLSSTIVPYRSGPGASVATPITLPDADQVRTYGLDGLGNWKTTNYTEVGSGGSTTSTAEVRSHNTVNEITAVTDTIGSGSPTTTGFTYLANGVLASDGVRQYVYDWNNRLIQVNNAAGTPLATYVYDYLGRRIQKTINDLDDTGFGGLTGDIPAGVTDYLYAGQQLIEQCNDASPGVWTQVNFWGQYIDELLFFSVPTPATYRVLSDLLYRSVALVTTSNVITEAYDTDAYGNTLCYSGPGTDDEWFTDDDVLTNNPINTTIFTGKQYDPESLIYWYRARYYSPQIGRFVSRDPIGIRGGINLYAYVGDDATNAADPLGLQEIFTPQGALIAAAAEQGMTPEEYLAVQAVAKKAAQAAAAAEAACVAMYATYKGLNICKTCDPKDCRSVLLTKIACLTALTGARAAFINARCDYILPGSIGRGSAIAQQGHQTELDKDLKRLADCKNLLSSIPSS